jgi:DNA repair exonuclease SbcCD nuclease subunit
MKILHVADTHLGYSAYRKATFDGINQREMDVYKAFEQFVDYAVNITPNLIIHAGDLFDNVRPNNRAISFAIDQFNRLSKKQIPVVLIAGNHEHPKLRETGHIFKVFDHIENVYPIYKEKYEKLEFKIKNEKLIIHAIPQCNSKKEYDAELKKLKPLDADYNIFTSHGSVTGVKNFYMNEFNELILPSRTLSKNFDYIALGHFHKYTKLSENAFYSGSTEGLSFTDAGEKKGFIELQLKNKTLSTSFIEIKTRPMVDVKPIKCSSLKLDEVMKKIKKTVQEIKPQEKTVRITLDEIPAHIYRGLDFNEIRKLTSNAVHYEIKANVLKEEGKKPIGSSKIGALLNEFKYYVESQKIKEKEIILELGIGYIEKIESIEEKK